MKQGPILLVFVGMVGLGWPGRASLETSYAKRSVDPEAAAAMAAAANRFLQGLNPEQRSAASFPLADAERLRWNFIPSEMHARRGAMIRDMTGEQRDRAHALLRTGLSAGGYRTATAVMELERILRDVEGAGSRFARDPEQYFFTVFGTPSAEGAWGWRVEGHHLSLHFTIVDGSWVATAPSFFGSNPAEVRDGPQRGLRILADREDVARALLGSLDQSQRTTAVINATAPNEILTGSDLDIDPLSPAGVRASALRPDQRALLLDLIEVYAGVMTEPLATARLSAIEQAGLDDIAFAWAGGTQRGERHYYRVQGPTFLIEYDNAQNDGNHVHSVWRDFDGDFGRDILREHLAAAGH